MKVDPLRTKVKAFKAKVNWSGRKEDSFSRNFRMGHAFEAKGDSFKPGADTPMASFW
jgi:hypothetical protein